MMKRSMKLTWRLIALLAVFSLVLGACATPTPVVQTVVVTQEIEKQVTVVSTVEVQKEVLITPTPEPGTGPTLNPSVSGAIDFWHFWASPVRRNGVQRFVALCKQSLPDIQVTDTVKPFGDIWTANLAAVAAGSGMPDVIVSDRPTLPKDAADGVYTDLQEWADRDGVKRDQFYDWAWDQSLYQGHTYGIPFETDVSVLFWNKNLFQQAGLDPEKPPTTWDELWTMADKLDKKDDKGNYTQIAFDPLINRGADIWQYLNDTSMIAPDGTPQINNPKMVEVLTWIKKWVDRYGGWDALQKFESQFGAPPNDNFMANGIAMRVDIFGYESALEFYRPTTPAPDGSKPRMAWGVGLMPHNTGAKDGDWSGGFALSIPKGAKNPEAAWEFIKCVTSAQGQASWARDTLAQPTNIEAARDPILSANPFWPIVDKALSVSTGGVYLAKYPNYTEQLSQRYEKVWTGELTPQQALDEAQQAVLDAIK